MERRVQLACEGSLDPAGGGEKLHEREGEIKASGSGAFHQGEERRLPGFCGTPDALEPVEGPPAFPIVAIALHFRDELHDPEVFRESGRDFRKRLVDFLPVRFECHAGRLVGESALRVHHVEDDDGLNAELNEDDVRELIDDQFACPGNPVAHAHPFGEGREGFNFPNDAPLHRFGHLRGGLEVVVGEYLLEVVERLVGP